MVNSSFNFLSVFLVLFFFKFTNTFLISENFTKLIFFDLLNAEIKGTKICSKLFNFSFFFSSKSSYSST
jgi:hypothetical protein